MKTSPFIAAACVFMLLSVTAAVPAAAELSRFSTFREGIDEHESPYSPLFSFLKGMFKPGESTTDGNEQDGEEADPVPAKYARTYNYLEGKMDEFGRVLDSRDSGERYPVTFGANLMPANCNRGEKLLEPGTMDAVRLWLDGLQEIGCTGVTVTICYPVYTEAFPKYDEYVAFYREVADEVRARGMVLEADCGVVFAGTSYSPVDVDYTGFTFEEYISERRAMTEAVLADLRPDYLSLGGEPDTEASLLGMPDLKRPERYRQYLDYVLDGLDKGETKVGAGTGSWMSPRGVETFASIEGIDFIGIHVYPVNDPCLSNLLDMIGIAKEHGKAVVMDEAWLYKTDTLPRQDIAAAEKLFRRDVYSFWAPLDEQFLTLMVRTARQENIGFISPFWSKYFYGYLDWERKLDVLPYSEVDSMVNREAGRNVLNGEMSTTGRHYQELIRENS